MHKSWGRSPILVRTLSLCFHQNFVWSFTRLCFLEDKSFLFGTLCHHEKCRGLVYLLEPCSLWELLISFVDICFSFLKWDRSLSMSILFILYAHWFCLVLLLNFGFNLVLVWVFDVIWTICRRRTFCVRPWLSWCFVQIVSPFGSWKVVHAYLLYVYLISCSLSLIQYIG